MLVRDASGHTTLAQRDSFRSQLGTRYRPRPDADPLIEGGQFDRLTERVEEYKRRDGRTASHKAEALAEAIELLTDPDGDDSVREEVAFEDVDGVGPETAGRLRSSGFVTRRDVLAADDEDLLDVTGVGPSTLENVREFVDGDD